MEDRLKSLWLVKVSHDTNELDDFPGDIFFTPPQQVRSKIRKQYCLILHPDVVCIRNWVLWEFGSHYKQKPWEYLDKKDLITFSCYQLLSPWLGILYASLSNTPHKVKDIISMNQTKYGVEGYAYIREREREDWISRRS